MRDFGLDLNLIPPPVLTADAGAYRMYITLRVCRNIPAFRLRPGDVVGLDIDVDHPQNFEAVGVRHLTRSELASLLRRGVYEVVDSHPSLPADAVVPLLNQVAKQLSPVRLEEPEEE